MFFPIVTIRSTPLKHIYSTAMLHYSDVIMSAIAIVGVSIIYSNVCSDADKKKPSKLHVTGLCEGNSQETTIMLKMFSFDDAIMISQHLFQHSSDRYLLQGNYGIQLNAIKVSYWDDETEWIAFTDAFRIRRLVIILSKCRNCSVALINCSGTLISVPKDL